MLTCKLYADLSLPAHGNFLCQFIIVTIHVSPTLSFLHFHKSFLPYTSRPPDSEPARLTSKHVRFFPFHRPESGNAITSARLSVRLSVRSFSILTFDLDLLLVHGS